MSEPRDLRKPLARSEPYWSHIDRGNQEQRARAIFIEKTKRLERAQVNEKTNDSERATLTKKTKGNERARRKEKASFVERAMVSGGNQKERASQRIGEIQNFRASHNN